MKILITGTSQGIGKAIAQKFLQEGHAVTGIDCGFAEAREYVKAHGFDTLYYLTEKGFTGEKL